MAQQQTPKSRSNLLLFILLYIPVVYFVSQNSLFRPPPAPEQTKALIDQARALEKEGREAGPSLARTDRIKKLEQAAQKYEEYFNQNKNNPEGYQARFQSVNVFDFLATTVETESNHWYDQAEARLKQMETGLLGKTGSVKLEVAGRTEERTGDLGKIAQERLDMIRLARDTRNRPHWDYKLMAAVVGALGGAANPYMSYFLALLLIVVFLKTITWPLQVAQYRSTQAMMRLQPYMEELQRTMKGRPAEEMQRRQLELYKEHKVNPVSGCLPALAQAVTLFPIYWMIRAYEYQFTNARFLWIGSSASKSTPWLADNLAQFDTPLFIIYLISMVGYSLVQPQPTDPKQAQTQKMMMYAMPVMFGLIMWQGQWSSAFVLYWLILNAVGFYQSWILRKRFPTQPYKPGTLALEGAAAAAVEAPVAGPVKPMGGVHRKKSERVSGNGKKTVGGIHVRSRQRGSGRGS